MNGYIIAGNRVYATCPHCEKLVRVTGFLGGWHICLTDEEIRQKALYQQRYTPPVDSERKDA